MFKNQFKFFQLYKMNVKVEAATTSDGEKSYRDLCIK